MKTKSPVIEPKCIPVTSTIKDESLLKTHTHAETHTERMLFPPFFQMRKEGREMKAMKIMRVEVRRQ